MKSMNGETTVKPVSTERLALLGGIAYAILAIGAMVFFVSNLGPHLGAIDAPLGDHVKLYTDYGQLVTLNNYLWVVPVPFFLMFLGGMYSLMRRAEGESSALSTAALAAGIAMIVPWITNTAVETLAVSIANNGGDTATVWALDSLGPTGSMGLGGLARAAFVLAASLLLLRSRIAPRWIGWFGIILTLLSAVGSLDFVAGDLFPVACLTSPLLALWVLGLSLALLRKPRPAESLLLERATA